MLMFSVEKIAGSIFTGSVEVCQKVPAILVRQKSSI